MFEKEQVKTSWSVPAMLCYPSTVGCCVLTRSTLKSHEERSLKLSHTCVRGTRISIEKRQLDAYANRSGYA